MFLQSENLTLLPQPRGGGPVESRMSSSGSITIVRPPDAGAAVGGHQRLADGVADPVAGDV